MEGLISLIEDKILEAAGKAVYEAYGIVPEEGILMVEQPRDPRMGDYSTNIAMRLARTLHQKPTDIAGPIVEKLKELLPEASSIEAVHPGFINFRIRQDVLSECINRVIEEADRYGRNDTGKGVHVLVEWVSANPTGDLHCGHARNAAWGDSICRLYEASGYDCLREYYINDAGNQINMLAESLISRYFLHFGKEYPLPQDGYHAQDIIDIANEIALNDGDCWLYETDEEKRREYFKKEGVRRELAKIEKDMDIFSDISGMSVSRKKSKDKGGKKTESYSAYVPDISDTAEEVYSIQVKGFDDDGKKEMRTLKRQDDGSYKLEFSTKSFLGEKKLKYIFYAVIPLTDGEYVTVDLGKEGKVKWKM